MLASSVKWLAVLAFGFPLWGGQNPDGLTLPHEVRLNQRHPLSFATTPSALKTLTFLSQAGGLSIHDGNPLLSDGLSRIPVQGSTRIGPRKLGAATTACHSGSDSPPPAPAKNGSAVLGLALPNVEKLAGIVDRRQAGYGRSMASERVCPVLVAAVERKPHRPSGDRERGQGFDPEDCGQLPSLLENAGNAVMTPLRLFGKTISGFRQHTPKTI